MIGLLLITHGEVGRIIVHEACSLLSDCPLPLECLAVAPDDDPDELVRQGAEICQRLDSGAGVLVLTDLYGSTPSNVATRLLEIQGRTVMVAGLNMPMLIRLMNYPELALEQLAEKACGGAREGVCICGLEFQGE